MSSFTGRITELNYKKKYLKKKYLDDLYLYLYVCTSYYNTYAALLQVYRLAQCFIC